MKTKNTNSFIEGLKAELDSKTVLTENGAVAFETAGGEGKNLVDFNFAISAMRGWEDSKIRDFYAKVYFENPSVALKYWAFCADCRGGLGERRTSRLIFDWLVENQTDTARKLLKLIPFYGRWDSLVNLANGKLRDDVIEIISEQLKEDLLNCRQNKEFSLLAKWCPSENTSSPKTRKLAAVIRTALDISPRQYRKMLSELRAGLKIVERAMSSKDWSEINYNAVPSKANIIYKNAFLKHDEIRRKDYLDKLASGDKSVKINASTSFPCDIVHSYMNGRSWSCSVGSYDEALEQMWKALPDYVKGDGNNTLVVADTSGSMTCGIGGGNMTAWSVAQSLAVYFSERTSGVFKDKYIMFSSNPFWVDFSNCKNLHDRLCLSAKYNECSNTDYAKTLKLILNTAVKNNLTQDEMPKTLITISDMQFDGYGHYNWDDALMENIKKDFEKHGYKLPKMVYWCVTGGVGRSTPVPLQTNDKGLILMSGFSSSLMTMALSGEVSPYKVILEKLNSERYSKVDECMK